MAARTPKTCKKADAFELATAVARSVNGVTNGWITPLTKVTSWPTAVKAAKTRKLVRLDRKARLL